MARIGLFYGSDSGATKRVAAAIKSHFNDETMAAPVNVGRASASEILSYDYLIVGAPTVGFGSPPTEWNSLMERLREADLSGKTVAVFGLGDQVYYSNQFADAMAEVADFFKAHGARVVGSWPTTGYGRTESLSVRDGHFIGLAIDEDNESDLTPVRIRTWLRMIAPDFHLGPVH